MSSDYEHYLAGCRSAGVPPLSEWRFRLLYGGHRRRLGEALTEPDALRVPASSPALEHLADLVRLGQEIEAKVRREGDEPGASASGVREPRVPIEPLLCGCTARPLPTPNDPDQSFWRT